MKEKALSLIRQFEPVRLIPKIENSLKESLVLRTTQALESTIPIGATKIGGRPDLPNHFEWPKWKNEPLSFIAQVNLENLPEESFLNALPSRGILSFFYSATQATWGFDPKDKGSWKVIHFEDQNLQRRDHPLDFPKEGKYESCVVSYQASINLPSADFPQIGLRYSKSNEELIDNYYTLEEQVQDLLNEGDVIHRLLGHPDEIQNNMQKECQLASHGVYCGDAKGQNSLKGRLLAPGAKNWVLLLQIDSDENTNMMWGDAGRTYYWISRDDLSKGNFSDVWMILQSG